ncbi:unnamed protein product [Symbiodinium sp. KB8]|nr:unnamed protein product [Symbiodinium sp. KB8]
MLTGFVGEVRECGWLELFLDDEVCYDDARDRVVSGLLHGWVSDCEMIRGEEVTPLKELPEFGRLKAGARIRLQLPSLCWHDKPMAEPSEKPGSDEGSTAVPETEEDTQTDGDVEIVEGLRVRRVGDWLELAARTLDEYAEDLKILTPKLADGTFAEHKLRWGENKWASELFEINAGTGKLFQRKGRRSVNPEQARVRVRLSLVPQPPGGCSVALLRRDLGECSVSLVFVLLRGGLAPGGRWERSEPCDPGSAVAEALHHPGPGSMLTEQCWEIVISFLYPISFLRQPVPLFDSLAIWDAMADAHFYHHQLFEDEEPVEAPSPLFREAWDRYLEEDGGGDPYLVDYINHLIEKQEQSHKFERQLLYAVSFESFVYRIEPDELEECLVDQVRYHFGLKPLVMMEHHHDDPEDSES